MEGRVCKLYRAGEIEVHLAGRTVRVRDDVHHPRPRVFDLLVYLIENRGRAVSRAELREALWPGVAVTDNSVMQCINEARKLLGDDSKDPRYIRTLSKAGYQFVSPVTAVDAAAPVIESAPVRSEAPAPSPDPPAARRIRVVPAITAAAASVVLAAAVAKFAREPGEAPYGELAWWKLDEGSGTAVAGSVPELSSALPAGVKWSRGIRGSALRFPGSEAVLKGPDAGLLPAGSAPRTLVAWVRTEAPIAESAAIFQHGDPAPMTDSNHSGRFALVLHESGVATFGSSNVIFGRTRIDDGKWHQVAGVFEGGDRGMIRLYVDGGEDATPAPVAYAVTGSWRSEWAIGRSIYNGTSVRGVVDDVRVYGWALDPPKIRSLHSCLSGADDISIDGRKFYASPVFGDNLEVLPAAPGEVSPRMRNRGNDFAGAVLVERTNDCSLASTRGAAIGENFRISVDLRVEAPAGDVTEAGPYFRSRSAAPGDGLIGGTSAGFWVHLNTLGEIRVMRLHPMATIAFHAGPKEFDARRFHRLVADARGDRLRVSLDGSPVEFDVAGVRTAAVQLDPKWESAAPPGQNHGSAGIAFGAARNRGRAGGQEARNLSVSALDPQ